MRDYQIASPSLEGVLNHSSLLYEGLNRPIALLRVLDGPATKGKSKEYPAKQDVERSEEDQKVLERYFHDLYGIFMNKLSFFVVQSSSDSDETVKLQAMLQEMIKVKRLMGDR
jgi:hypothetical protein